MRRSSYTLLFLLAVSASALVAQESPEAVAGASASLAGVEAAWGTALGLTPEERAYLTRKKTVRVCVDPQWMPFESIAKGRHVGMSADYLEVIAERLGITFELVPTATWSETLEKGETRECDIFALAMDTPERRRYMDFTTPYIVIPLVIATTNDKPFIADINEVLHRPIGMVKGYAFVEFLRADHPSMDIAEYETVYDGLAAVERGEVYGFIDNLTTIAYEITHSFSSSLKISGRLERNWELGIAVRNDDPLLFSVMDKAVKSLDPGVVEAIQAKWVSVTYEQPFDYDLLWKILVVLGAAIAMGVYRYWKVKGFNRTLRELNQRLQESEAAFRSLVNSAHEGIAVMQDRRLVFVNPSVCAMTGYDEAALLGLESFSLMFAPENRETLLANHLNRIEGKPCPVRYESKLLRSDGSKCPIDISGVLISWNGRRATLNVLSDMSERKATEEAVRFMALHDNLTRLPNRYLLMERLERALAHARRVKEPLALLFIDLDGFKEVNDTYGHPVGDLLIKGVAGRIQSLMRDSDTLARMGGDEFVILMTRVDGQAGVETLRARIDEALATPFRFDSLEIQGHASVGFALFPDHGDDEEALLRVADQRMYEDKQAKK